MEAIGPLPPELDAFVRHVLSTGRYETADKVVQASLQIMQDRESRLEALRQDIDLAMAQIERGETIHIEDEAAARSFFDGIKAEGRAKLNALSAAKSEQ